uniref:Uncharacterized protein LOC104266546 n=1 Tax=Phallusia mammillata TaxID=59560 RepID=A0A6F9DJ37_9ASCI|nr:uncharacterized protein LOC104266546 [Phallusia mammillata]
MRAGVAASRKLKPKTEEASKSASSLNSNLKFDSKSRPRHNGTSTGRADNTDSSKRIGRHKTPTPNCRHERYAPKSSSVTLLEVPGGVPSTPLVSNGSSLNPARYLAVSLTDDSNQGSTQNLGQAQNQGKSPGVTLVRVADTADAFMAAGAAAKGEERLAVVKKQYYRKAIALMSVGGFIFLLGVTFAALFFAGYAPVQMAGPICLAIGLLLGVCGLVWIPIIKTKLKRKQQMMTRTFSL